MLNALNYDESFKYFSMAFQDETGNGSLILDGNVEEQAILELAGRGRFSEGYRDKPSDIDF